ncbi:hypothetical protein ACWDKQ_27935 [Saccharopolyspora sp. NPDC000995]
MTTTHDTRVYGQVSQLRHGVQGRQHHGHDPRPGVAGEQGPAG